MNTRLKMACKVILREPHAHSNSIKFRGKAINRINR